MGLQKYILISAAILSSAIIFAPVYMHKYKMDECKKVTRESILPSVNDSFVNEHCLNLLSKG